MKLTKLFSKLWLSAAALLAFSACSNEDLPTQTVESTPKTKTVKVNLSVGGSEEFRAIYAVDPANGSAHNLEMPENNVILRIAVKRGTGEPIFQDIEFTKVQGQNYATYSGDINVPTTGEGNYKIAAMLLSEVGGKSFAAQNVNKHGWLNFDFSTGVKTLTSPSNGKLDINVPYVTAWQNLDVLPSNVANSTTLLFKPVGTILRIRIKNEDASPQTFYTIRMSSEAAGMSGAVIDLYEEYDGAPMIRNTNTTTFNYKFPEGSVTVGAGEYSPWFYVWVYPRKDLQIIPYTVASLQNVVNGSFVKVFSTRNQIATGSVPLTLIFNSKHNASFEDLVSVDEDWGASTTTPPVMPLSLLSSGVVNADKNAFVEGVDTDNANVGYFTLAEARAAFASPVTIGGGSYSLPTMNEIAAIIPWSIDMSNIGGPKIGRAYNDVIEQAIKIGNVTQDYKADYKTLSGKTYAIRMKNASNRYRTAFRYSVYTEGTYKGLLVEAIYLGASDAVSAIDHVANEQYWTDNIDKIVSKKIPAYGYIPFAENIMMSKNTGGFFWTSTQLDVASGMCYQSSIYLIGMTVATSAPNKLPIFLMKRN